MNKTIAELVKDEALVADGYERVKGDLAAVPVDQLVQINLDIQQGTRTILGALPEMQALRERIVAELPAFDIAAFDKLEDYVQALRYAQTGFLIASQPPDDLEQLLEDGGKLKARLEADARSLSLYGLFSAKKLEQLKGGNGLDNLAQDLELLSRALMDSWEQIQGKALTPLEDVQTAARIGLRLTRIAGLRDQGPARLAAATELRMRAFTVVLRTYEEARAAIGYLRRSQDDLETIAPTLYPGKGRRKATAAVENKDSNVASPANPAVPGTSAAPASEATPVPAPAQPSPSVSSNGPFMG
jgi:hypothetical protein